MTVKIEMAYDYLVGENATKAQSKVLETIAKFVADIPHKGKIRLSIEDGPSRMAIEVK